jgi:hypothetical protein
MDNDEDRSWPVWAGLLPVHLAGDPPIADADVVSGQEPPAMPA